MDIFSESIGKVTSQHTISFQHVWHWTKKASEMYRSKSKYVDSSKLHIPLLDIHPEGKLQREVKDIIDELDMMIYIHKKQREMFRRFCKLVEHILDPEGRWREGEPLAGDTERQFPAHAVEHNMATDSPFSSFSSSHSKRDEAVIKRKKNQLDWFRMQSQELISDADDRVDELEGLKKAAESTAQSVNDLLSLKQQQASVVQAWESAKQAEEAVRQGRSIMMFTIVTVLFLPHSFMSSFFGMNNIELGSDGTDWTMSWQTKLIVIVSFGIVLVSVILAFSSLLQAFIWSLWEITSIWIITTLPIYRNWILWSDNWQGTSLMKRTKEKGNKWKEEVRREKLRQSGRESDGRKAKKDEDKKKWLAPVKAALLKSPAPPPSRVQTWTATGATMSTGPGQSRQRHSLDASSSTGNLLAQNGNTNTAFNSDSSKPASATGQSMTGAVGINPRLTGTTLANDNSNSRHDVIGDDNNV